MTNKELDLKRQKLITDFYLSYDSYKLNKKDYFYVKLIFEHFCSENKDINDEMKLLKLKSIINTYRSNKNEKFSLLIYNQCEFFWRYLNLYILSELSFISGSLKKLKNDSYDKVLNDTISLHLIKCDEIVNELGIGSSNVSKKYTISSAIKKFEVMISDIRKGRI